MTLLFSAIFPVIIFLYAIYLRDTEREPWRLLLKCFFWGVVSFIPAVLIEAALDEFKVFPSLFLTSLYDAFVVAALTEEFLKFLILYWIIWKHKEFDQHYDGIVYAVYVSLGFAVIENIFYVLGNGFGTAVIRAFLSVPGHCLWGVVMGYYFALAKFSSRGKIKFLLVSILLPIFLHGLYDFFLMYGVALGESTEDSGLLGLGLMIEFLVLIIFTWKIGLQSIKKHVATDKAVIETSKKEQDQEAII